MRTWNPASPLRFSPPALEFHWLAQLRAGSPDWLRGLRRQIPERGRAANMAAELGGSGQQLSQEMMEGQELPVDMETITLDRDAEDIDLNHYRIGKIEGFEVLKKVKTLCLRQNLIKCIENLEELQSLRELDLYDNQIKKIENLDTLTELEILDISFNLLRNIEGVDKLTKLKKLFLVNNKINKIENLSNLCQLEMLELGSNRIRAIENIDTLTNLDSLFLGKNKITKLQNLDALSNLTVLSIQSNRLTKMEGLQSLVNLRELYLSHNGIEVIEGLENNNKLTMLDIAANRIKKIENVSHLTELLEFWSVCVFVCVLPDERQYPRELERPGRAEGSQEPGDSVLGGEPPAEGPTVPTEGDVGTAQRAADRCHLRQVLTLLALTCFFLQKNFLATVF
ncbi:protein phosphatase 1 regulatory subunit 7 isoform X4 [Pipistrellus kuhlii]|uniref:protein phosphatase 1 regulatory subunit 7 isoform X4 n=1 Tax=Pipistrellus kuhlii TaxID=59472 RepID=UPI001E270A0F|nr:protein phosphatase 1 regulatory subunit 7 isoform X4 [Pipistrellus kuhlii]